jgi:hypothetical protein
MGSELPFLWKACRSHFTEPTRVTFLKLDATFVPDPQPLICDLFTPRVQSSLHLVVSAGLIEVKENDFVWYGACSWTIEWRISNKCQGEKT